MKKYEKKLLLTLFGEQDLGGNEELTELTQRTSTSGDRQEAPDAGEQQTSETREKHFRELMEGEYKDLFTAYFQETFNRRFKLQKGMQEELQRARNVIEAAAQRFGTRDEGELVAAIRAEEKASEAPTSNGAAASPIPVREENVEELIKRAVEDAVRVAQVKTERAVIERIKARGMRPTESALIPGISREGQGSVSRLSRAERAEMAQRAARGEHIEL